MIPNKPRQLEAAVDGFIAKTLRINEPLTSFVASKPAKTFTAMVRAAILKQAEWAADYLIENQADRMILPAPEREMTILQRRMLDERLATEMPSLDYLVSLEETEDYLRSVFEWGVKSNYRRQGLLVKGMVKAKTQYDFELTNPFYIQQIQQQADYLLHRSTIDATTRNRIIDLIERGLLGGDTIDEVAADMADQFKKISKSRAFIIANTETANAMGKGNLAAMKENGVEQKHWVTAGGNPCRICRTNEQQGAIPIDADFASGHKHEGAHPSCECYTEGEKIDLMSIDIWLGD